MPSTSFTTSKLQHEFKHAGDFGVTSNWNKATGETYQQAIENHIETATDVYKSTYIGHDVHVYFNKNTDVGAYTDLSGNYIGIGFLYNISENRLEKELKNLVKLLDLSRGKYKKY